MKNFSIDYSCLDTKIDNKVYRLVDVQHRLEKIAFDIVRFKDGDPEELWQIQSADDGDYIVAKYDMESSKEVEKTASASNWEVLISQASGDINIFYKRFPVVKTNCSKVGLAMDDLDALKRFLPKKLESDKELVKSLIKTLGATERFELIKLYPELSL